MTGGPAFELVNICRLRIHEEVNPVHVEDLQESIRSDGVLWEPIWVGRLNGFDVILNGHHRYHALVRLGAQRIPAFVFDYGDSIIRLDRWGAGPPLTKEEVVRRAKWGTPFPPKTTRHTVLIDLPKRPTRLDELLERPPGPPSEAPTPPRSTYEEFLTT
ncbi:MAG: ParB N-terminal domain-containing protein [Thermoplasmata archaeon]